MALVRLQGEWAVMAVLRRLASAALGVLLVLLASFCMMHAVPGGPFDAERALSPEVEASLRAAYHLDWPLWKQFLQYIGPFNLGPDGVFGSGQDRFAGVLALDLGPSLSQRDFSVAEILRAALPLSFELGLVALAWSVPLGVALGTLAAAKHGSFLDALVRVATTAGIVLPGFALASLCVLVFAFAWPVFPVAGWSSARHMVLPAFALGLPTATYVARLTRSGVLENLGQDYVRTALGKGVSPARAVLRHALRSALLPVVAYLGPASAAVLTGSLVIEKIFFLPGAGTHFVNSALNRDYTLAMGVTLVYTLLVFALNSLADLLAGWIDPRGAQGSVDRARRSSPLERAR